MDTVLHKKIADFPDGDVLELLHELQLVTGLGWIPFERDTLFKYLSTCLYHSSGAQKRYPITRSDLDNHDPHDSFLLRRKLDSLSGSMIYVICDELVRNHNTIYLNESAEVYLKSHLYSFLNEKVPNPFKPKRKPPFRFG